MPSLTFSQVEEMKRRGLTDEKIAQLAEQRGYDLPEGGILGNLAKTVLVKPAVRTGQAIGALGAKAFGVDDERISQAIQKDVIANLGPLGKVRIEGQKPFGEGGGKQIVADALEAGSIYAPYGRIASGVTKLTSRVLPKFARQSISRFAGPVGAGASGGYAVDVAEGLRNDEENPFTPGIGTAVGTAIPGGAQVIAPAFRTMTKAARFGVAKFTGLDQDTLTTIITRPQALSEAQRANIDRYSLANELQEAFKGKLDDLSSTGKAYKTVRGSGKVNFKDNPFDDVLNKNGVKVSNGKIEVGPESLPLSNADINALEDFYVRFGQYKELSANGFLNARKALDNLAKWEAGKTDDVKRIARALRKKYDEVGKAQLKGLKDLDDKYAPLVRDINDARKRLFNKDGSLQENAVNQIANVGNAGRELRAAKLEKIYPGITQKAQIVKAIEDIARAEGQKVGTYAQVALGAGGGWAVGGPVGALVGFILSSPAVAVPIIKTYGATRGFGARQVNALVGKLTKGQPLTDAEMILFRQSIREHIKNISPGDQFLDSRLGKATQKYAQEVQPGLSTRDVTRFLHEGDKDVMIQFIDEARGQGKMTEDKFREVEKLAERFGISMDEGLANVANKFEQILQGNRDFTGTVLPGMTQGK